MTLNNLWTVAFKNLLTSVSLLEFRVKVTDNDDTDSNPQQKADIITRDEFQSLWSMSTNYFIQIN